MCFKYIDTEPQMIHLKQNQSAVQVLTFTLTSKLNFLDLERIGKIMEQTGAHEGKFLDRSPWLRAAGNLSIQGNENVADCLKFPVTEDEGRPFVCKTALMDYKLPPRRTNIYKGFYSDVRQCIQPELDQKSFFDVLTKEFQETVYDSYWKKPLGRLGDQAPWLPPGMNPEEICFGKPTPKDIDAGLLISPPKSCLDVIEESRVGHEMYKRTHNDYDPGEKLGRNYVKPFQEGLVWGKETPCDPQGGCIKKVMTHEDDGKTLVSKVFVDYQKRTKPLIGKVLAPNNNIQCVPENHTFGRPNKQPLYGAGELIKDSPISFDKLDLLEEFSHVNEIRIQLSKRDPAFIHRDFIDAFHEIDINKTGCLPLNKTYRVLADFKIFPDRQLFDKLLKRLNISDNQMVNYEKMANLLNNNCEFPVVKKLDDVPVEFRNYETTNQAAHRYHCSRDFDIKNIRAAGIPASGHFDVASVVSPSIFSNYGLKPEDFFISRSPQYLRTLFSRMGCDLDNESFKKVWCAAGDNNECVSVHSFYTALQAYK